MKTYQAHLPDALHTALKARLKRSKITLAEGIELGALLVLTETGAVTSPEGAKDLGAADRTTAIYRRILDGENW